MLAPHEIDGLLEVFRRRRADGLAVLFITHKLREALAVADRITVLRRGAVTASLPAAGVTESGLVATMLGAEPREAETPVSHAWLRDDAPVVLELSHVEAPDPAGRLPLHDISLALHAGEILGGVAVSGNGQKELGECILGLRRVRAGTIRLFGRDASGYGPGEALAAGAGCMPEEPLGMGSVPAMSVLENMILSDRDRYAGQGGLALRWRAARADVEGALARFSLPFPRLDVPAATLSGGNVARMIFVRELARAEAAGELLPDARYGRAHGGDGARIAFAPP